VKVKGISWLGIGTDSFQGTLRFFTDVLGLEAMIVDDSNVAMLKAGDQVVEIFGPGTRGRERTSPPVVAFEVDDVAAARDELADCGIETIGEIGMWNGFEWLYFRGPDGHVYVIQKTPPPGWETRGS